MNGGDTFEFEDSEVQAVHAEGDLLCIVFSAASVQRSTGPGSANLIGHLKGLTLQLAGAVWVGEPGDGIGRLSEGALSIGTSRYTRVPLPFTSSEAAALALRFANGTTLSVRASSVMFQLGSASSFVESSAC